MTGYGFDKRPTAQRTRPRRVVGGMRLASKEWPPRFGWVGTRLVDLIAAVAPADELREGWEYGKRGQVRSLAIEPGRITADVQGIVYRPHHVEIEVGTIDDGDWDRVIAAMSDQAIYAARLLGGELPEGIEEEIFAGLGMHLFPAPGDIAAVEVSAGQPWDRHACCAALLAAQAIEADPTAVFTLRGIRADELIDRLRAQRSGPASPGWSASGAAVRHGLEQGQPLAECTDGFWSAGPTLDRVEIPLRAPEVNHALLRRLGPSPFEDGKFPLVGLLATCYDSISASALRAASPDAPDDDDTG